MKKRADGTVWLDRDCVTDYGPETITISKTDNTAVYQLYIHDYTNRNKSDSTAISASRATVRVYYNNKLSQIFTITPNRRGIKVGSIQD